MTNFEERVWKIAKNIPKGKITTYGEIARKLGRPKAARAVGNALNKNPYAPQVPCHRVVKANGEIGGYAKGVTTKITILKKEKIEIKNNKIINFRRKLYKFA